MSRLIGRLVTSVAAACIALALLSLGNAAQSADTVSTANQRVINVTPDSAPGWFPSVEVERQALRVAVDYMADRDAGRYAQAYAILGDANRKNETLAEFSELGRRFNAQAGAVIERRIVTVTWTKDPANGPGPGIYVAIDVVSRFANIDRDCGYLVLFQAPSSGDFSVMREETNILDNATAAAITKESSAAEVDKTWAKLSANCPGYQAMAAAPLPEASGPTIGYPSVEAALAALHAKTGVVFKTQDGWTLATDDAGLTLWSFPPPGHPAYPSAVRRHVVERDGAVQMEMAVQCEASKQACDDLVRSFEALNAKVREQLRPK